MFTTIDDFVKRWGQFLGMLLSAIENEAKKHITIAVNFMLLIIPMKIDKFTRIGSISKVKVM